MFEFTCALVMFVASHQLPTTPRVRARLVSRLGEARYRLLYGLLSLAVMAWVISAALRAPTLILWWPAEWHALVPVFTMPASLALIASAALSPNPLSINMRSLTYRPEHPGVVSITRHPMLWGFVLWAFSHLVANGDLVSAILFGGLGLFALFGMRRLDRKIQQRLGPDEWHGLAGNTSILPFAAILAGRARLHIDRHLCAGLVLGGAIYTWFVLHAHELLFGVAPLWRVTQ